MKYIVSANTCTEPYGAIITFFGIFDTKQEAIDYMMNGPVPYKEYIDEDGNTGVDKYDFMECYTKWGYDKSISEEEYLSRFYITEFNNFPVSLGGYVE